MIVFENVSLSYAPDREILHQLTFSVQPGTFHFVAGASGTGKSTLLRLLALSLKPTQGSLHLFGQDVTRLEKKHLPGFRRRIGMVYQDFRLLDHLTVEENVGLPLKVAGEKMSEIRPKVAELLRWVGLEDHAYDLPPVLSGGQKQRAAIARAVITKPDLLLADEPTGNLDPYLSLKFMYLFETLHQGGTTILYATHDEHLISQFHYPILRLKDGRLQQQAG